MNKILETKVKEPNQSIYFTLESTPRHDSLLYEWVAYIMPNTPIKFRTLRNFFYEFGLLSTISPEGAHKKREKLIKKYNLKETDVGVRVQFQGI